MSANKYKSTVSTKPLSIADRLDRRMYRLSMQVSRACDDFQIRRNGYKSNGLRGIINASVLKSQSENK